MKYILFIYKKMVRAKYRADRFGEFPQEFYIPIHTSIEYWDE